MGFEAGCERVGGALPLPSDLRGGCVARAAVAWLKTESARMASWGVMVASLEADEGPGRPRREMKLMKEREWDVTLAFRDGTEGV